MGALSTELERQEGAARARIEELRRLLHGVKEQLAAAEERLARLQTARETVTELLAETGSNGEVTGDEHEATRPGGGSVNGLQSIPRWRPGLNASVLPTDYREFLKVLTSAGRPLLAEQIAAGTGLESEKPSTVESVRSKLRRLVQRGWLTEDVPDAFALPSTSGDVH